MRSPDVRVHIRRVILQVGSEARVDARMLPAAIESALSSRLDAGSVLRRAPAGAPPSTADVVADAIASRVARAHRGGDA